MRAIIIAVARTSRQTANRWGSLAPLVDRSFLQHLVEYLLDQGAKTIDFVLGPEFGSIRQFLGDGVRWGSTFHYHFSADASNPFHRLRLLAPEPNSKLLLAFADRLPAIEIREAVHGPDSTVFYSSERGHPTWTGLAILNAEDLAGIPEVSDEEELYEYLRVRARLVEVVSPLAARSYDDLLKSNRRALNGEHPGLMPVGREVQPGLWFGRNVSVHPTAKLIPPAYLGENCRVGAMVRVGPSAVIGKDCVIDRRTNISDSVICHGSYVGEQLALSSVVVNHSTLVNTRLGVEIDGVDELLLGSATGTPWKTKIALACERALAALLFLMASPLLMLLFVLSRLGWGPVLRNKRFVRTPTFSEPGRWRVFNLWSFADESTSEKPQRFLLFFLPALGQVALGRLAISGAPPVNADELMSLPAPQRAARLQTRSGILRKTNSGTKE